MDEYHRDSLRELRRNEREKGKPRQKGSLLITLLIIALFLAAAGFYIATAKQTRLRGYYDTLKNWAGDAVSVFSPEDSDEVRETVDSALAEQHEAD